MLHVTEIPQRYRVGSKTCMGRTSSTSNESFLPRLIDIFSILVSVISGDSLPQCNVLSKICLLLNKVSFQYKDDRVATLQKTIPSSHTDSHSFHQSGGDGITASELGALTKALAAESGVSVTSSPNSHASDQCGWITSCNTERY